MTRRERLGSIPKFIVKETRQEKPRPWETDDEPRTLEQWFVVMDEEELTDWIAAAERPGFGMEFESVTYYAYRINMQPFSTTKIAPITMEESALELTTYDHSGCTLLGRGVKVDIGLRGKGHDPESIFWDSHGNSFAIVKPRPGLQIDARLTSEQGVMLMSINGTGEIRWDVNKSGSTWPENVEAVKHFGLTWRE